MSASGESPPDEDLAVNPVENNVKADPSKDISDAETEPAMLDEEEMPSYVSLTSLPRVEELTVEHNNPQQSEEPEAGEERALSPYRSEQGADSVCVLSSGEESDRRPYEMMEDYDSEDMDMEDEDEEDEDEDDSCLNDEEEDSDGDIEPEQFERSSDDFVLRYDGGLEKHHKERSRSLQDLTNSRGNLSRFVGKRRSIDLMGTFEPELSRKNIQSLEDPLGMRKRMPRSGKYDHVPSKVKLYIQGMKEQRKRSAERSSRENPSPKNFSDVNSRGDSADVSRARLNPASRIIKSYVQNAINELETADNSRVVADDENYNDRRPIDDAAELIATSMVEKMKETEEIGKNLRADGIAENLAVLSENFVKKPAVGKSNGLIDYSQPNRGEKIIEPMEVRASNGQEEISAIFDLRSLSYEEYTNGDKNSSKQVVEDLSSIQEKNGLDDCTETAVLVAAAAGVAETGRPKVSSVSKSEDEKISKLLPGEVLPVQDGWNLRELTIEEESSRRKTAQVDRAAYQRTLDENVSLKRELEEMRKTLEQYRSESEPLENAYKITLAENTSLKRELIETKNTLEQYRADNKPVETKVASVQTEIVENARETSTTVKESKLPSTANKLSSSSVTSAPSSIEQWTDSNCSLAISIDPPNIEKALNSDDSSALGERPPVKTLRPHSASFITSSRILQTLASITQGRKKPVTPLAATGPRNTSHLNIVQGQSKGDMIDPLLSGNEGNSLRAKKRKASDMLGPSVASSESFKMPHAPSADTRRKMSSDSATDGGGGGGAYKTTRDRTSRTDARQAENGEECAEHGTGDYEDNETTTDAPENVKYFVYHEEPDSKERSFLIQADDSSKNEDTGDKGGNARECGPFLLGNVEIRMSEANGTINIWGKEINQSIEDPDVDGDMEDSESHDRSPFAPRSHVCQSTPHSKFPNVNTPVCSANKKTRITPKFSRSGIGKYLRTATSSMMRTSVLGNVSHSSQCGSSPVLDNNRTYDCEHCESNQKRVKWPSCEYLASSRIKQHSCCLHDVEINERECDCVTDSNELLDDSTIYESISNILSNHKKCTNSLNNLSDKHLFASDGNEESCRNRATHCRRSSGCDQDFHRTNKRCSSCSADLPSCNTRLTPGDHKCREYRARSRSHVSCEDEDHPLISNEGNCETPETKRRRLSGKKVRGILTDLLRGCGGCRELNSTSKLPSVNLQNTIPKIRVTPCSSPQASCSKRTACPTHSSNPSNDVVNEKCCNSCNRRVEMRAQLEQQFEIFRVDMERLRSRSDAVLEMLNLLKAETD